MQQTRLNICFIAMLLFTSSVAIAANSYRTDLLQQMAETMNISQQLQQQKDGEYYQYLSYNGRAITVIISQDEVVHIGFSLFTPTQRKVLNSPVCNFLERYALEITLPMKRERSISRKLNEDGIFFRSGSFEFLKLLQNDTTYQIGLEILNNKRYTISWSKDGKEKFAVNFPIEYDLLAGTNMTENERRVLEDVRRSSTETRQAMIDDERQLEKVPHGKCYILKGEYFYNKQLNTNRYYVKSKKDAFKLFYHRDYVLESLSNLMTTAAIDNDYDIQIRLVKYGFVQDTICVKLNQWLNYCIDQGCMPYFGIIAIDKDIADCEIIMKNVLMGYIHVMRLNIDIGTLEERKGLIKARLNSFVPTTRVRYLFDELKI